MTEPNDVQAYRARLRCSVAQIDDIFADCMREALGAMSAKGIDDYLDGATLVGGLGRGTELVLIYLQEMPDVVRRVGDEAVLSETAWLAQMLSKTANGKAINPFLASMPSVARRLGELKLLRDYFLLVERMATEGSEGLIPMLNQVRQILTTLSIGGLKNWIEYGLRTYRNQSWKMGDYFSLQTPDSIAALQRERAGTLYADHERRLKLYLKAMWDNEEDCHPYSLAFNLLRRPSPRLDSKGFHIPDVYEDLDGVTGAPLSNSPRHCGGEGNRLPAGGAKIPGLDRYRALLAHLAAHRAYSKPFIADNFNRFQHLFIEAIEDCRVEWLAARDIPGLRKLFRSLHPVPVEDACPEGWSPIRHQATMLSRALTDPEGHPYTHPVLLEYVDLFYRRMAQDPYDTKIATELGVRFMVAIGSEDFRLPKVFFKDTEISYRDDNSYLWIFLEDTVDQDDFHSEHSATNPQLQEAEEGVSLARHLPEWDYATQSFRPDWVTVYESIQPPGSAADIDRLLEKHKPLARRLKQIVDLLKPQNYVRIRYQEEGELDLDVAIRSMVDYRSGVTPDTRIHMSHRPDDRDIAVTLLLDLSESINETPPGCECSIKQLSQEAVSLLAWAIEALGDPYSITGFASNTRHEVRYLYFKGFNEPWGDEPKARVAAMNGGYSTRMGAAIRNAGHYLGRRRNEKKLLLVLTDGAPHDIDVDDEHYLRQDTRKAVEELDADGIYTHCISLDPNADEYVAQIFGSRYTVIDRIERLPEKLPELFMALTK